MSGKCVDVGGGGSVEKTDDGGELLFPCVPEVLKSVDLEKGIIVADPMEMDE